MVRWFYPYILVSSSCYKKTPHTRKSILTVLDAGKSKIKVLPDLVSGSPSYWFAFLLYHHTAKRKIMYLMCLFL